LFSVESQSFHGCKLQGVQGIPQEGATPIEIEIAIEMLLLAALGLALIMEGIPYFLWSEKMPEYLRFLSERSPSTLRKMGLAAIIAGLVFLALARKFF